MSMFPTSPESALQMALQRRDLAQAKALALQIIQTNPSHPAALLTLADITLTQGLWDEAGGYADRAAAVLANDPRPFLLQARIASARGDTPAALAACDKTLALRPGDANAILLKASVQERAGQWQEAMETIRPLVDRPGGPTPPVTLTLAQCLLRSGDVTGAIAALDRSLASFAPVDPTAREMRRRLLMLKSKALDKAKDYDGAILSAIEAKKLAGVPHDPAQYEQRITALMSATTRERLASIPRAAPTAARHVFIAGMPRSGTTLVEQIIDAHPDAVGVGEMKELDIFAARLPQMIGSSKAYPDCLADLNTEQVNQLRGEYEQAINRYGFGAASLYLNKNLENTAHLALISVLFPDAKIIVTRRDPRDIIVSSIMSAFRAEKHPYFSSVEHAAHAYQQWERLITHYRANLDLPFLDVGYEDLVRDQDAWTHKLLEFVGLPYNERCSRFWQSGRTVMTLSYDQVSKPMYDTSIGRWKNYEKHLGAAMSLAQG